MEQLTEIRKVMESLEKHYVKVGVLADSAAMKYAPAHEFGVISQSIPERSFIRAPLEKQHKEIVKEAVKDIEYSIARGETNKNKLLGNLGLRGVNACKEWIESQGNGTWEPLTDNYKRRPSGAKIDSSSKILQDTGLLINSIAYEVA